MLSGIELAKREKPRGVRQQSVTTRKAPRLPSHAEAWRIKVNLEDSRKTSQLLEAWKLEEAKAHRRPNAEEVTTLVLGARKAADVLRLRGFAFAQGETFDAWNIS